MQAAFSIELLANHKFFFLDEDGDVLSVSSEQEFEDNEEFMRGSQQRIPVIIYANLNDISAVREQLKFGGDNLKAASWRGPQQVMDPNISAYIDAAVKREVAAYCAMNLPRLVAEQVKQQMQGGMVSAIAGGAQAASANMPAAIPEED